MSYAYMGMGIADGASAKRSAVQLWNPASSGKILRIGKISIANQATAPGYPILGLDLRVITTALTNVGTQPLACKNIGGPASIAQIRWQNLDPTPQGIPGAPCYEFWVTAASRDFDYSPPLEIAPGQGAYIATASPSVASEPLVWLITSWQWDEV